MVYSKNFSSKKTPQSQPVPGKSMVLNDAGGYAFEATMWQRLDRFLIIGCEGGSYYKDEKSMTIDNAKSVLACLKVDGIRVVNRTVEVSDNGLAAKNAPAVFVMALAISYGDKATKQLASQLMHKVCRTATDLFAFIEETQSQRGWGRSFKRSVRNWYLMKSPESAAYQMCKYRNRNGWTHRDTLRLSHPKPGSLAQDQLFKWAVGKGGQELSPLLPKVVHDTELLLSNKLSEKDVVKLINERSAETMAFRERQKAGEKDLTQVTPITWEMLPTELLNKPRIWEALLPTMGLTATLRNLGKMSEIGLLTPLSDASKLVCDRLRNKETLQRERAHPLNLLIGGRTYGSGRGVRSEKYWTVDIKVKEALEDAFYLSFKTAQPTGKTFLIGLDVSSSMTSEFIPGISSCMLGAAFAMMAARMEKNSYIVGFAEQIIDLGISEKDTLQVAMNKAQRTWGGTDCSLLYSYARTRKINVDCFLMITDNMSWYGGSHPFQELNEYRKAMGRRAKSIQLSTTASGTTLKDPDDADVLDIPSFDASIPQLITNFVGM